MNKRNSIVGKSNSSISIDTELERTTFEDARELFGDTPIPYPNDKEVISFLPII